MKKFSKEKLVECQCGYTSIPNISTEDLDGFGWICLNPNCGDYAGKELGAEDLEFVGVPLWLAQQLTALIEQLEEEREELAKHALERVEEVFGEEVTKTTVWREFFGDKGVQE